MSRVVVADAQAVGASGVGVGGVGGIKAFVFDVPVRIASCSLEVLRGRPPGGLERIPRRSLLEVADHHDPRRLVLKDVILGVEAPGGKLNVERGGRQTREAGGGLVWGGGVPRPVVGGPLRPELPGDAGQGARRHGWFGASWRPR